MLNDTIAHGQHKREILIMSISRTAFVKLFLKTNALFLALSLWSHSLVAQTGPSRDTPVDREGWRQLGEEFLRAKPKRLDPTFKRDQEIYEGRGSYAKLNYCVIDRSSAQVQGTSSGFTQEQLGALLVPVSRDSLRPLRGSSVAEFANELYDCDDIGSKVLNKLEKEDAGLVIYYLNSEYKLKLKQERGGGKKAKRIN